LDTTPCFCFLPSTQVLTHHQDQDQAETSANHRRSLTAPRCSHQVQCRGTN
jgi:hypothetical protein